MNSKQEDSTLERYLISSILRQHDKEKQARLIDNVQQIVKPDDFTSFSNKMMYAAIIEIQNKNLLVDFGTLVDYFQRKKQLEKVGGIAAITNIENGFLAISNIEEYAKSIKDKSVRRDYIRAANQIKDMAANIEIETNKMTAVIEEIIYNISQNRYTSAYKDSKMLMKELMQEIEAGGNFSGIDTGYKDLNRFINGFKKGNLIILGARPAMGKTALALNFALKVASLENMPVAFCSLEMTDKELSNRLLSSISGIEQRKILSNTLIAGEKAKLKAASDEIAEMPLYIDDTPGLAVSELRSKIRRLKREKGIGLLIVDYLQLLSTDKKRENKVQEITDISRGLKSLAKEINIPVLALSQLSRKTEDKENKRPTLASLRESGSIEQDADIVMLLYREAYYKKNADDITELIIAKNRNGATGTVNLKFNPALCMFYETKSIPGTFSSLRPKDFMELQN